MLDIALLRNQSDVVRASLSRRGLDTASLDAILEADERRRQVLTEMECLKHEKNVVSDSIPRRKKAGEDTAPIVAEMRQLGERI